jgi:hypothetical protein
MAGRPAKHSRVNIRKTHPGLYHSIMTLGVMSILLGGNFWYSRPAFNPYGWDKTWVGLVFFGLGVAKIVFLNVYRDLRMVRLTIAMAITWMCFWGFSNTQQFFAGKTSLQLPILYVALSVIQIPLLLEAPVNPMTEKKQ